MLVTTRYTALVVAFLGSTLFTNAQSPALYWIGGSGEWSDASHWSHESGGPSAGTTPNSQSTVLFDANSANDTEAIFLTGNASLKNLTVAEDFVGTLISSPAAQLTCYGEFSAFAGQRLNLLGATRFAASGSTVWSAENLVFSGPVVFEGAGSYSLEGHLLVNNNTLTIDCGGMDLHHYSIVANGLTMNGSTYFDIAEAKLFISDFLDVSSGVHPVQGSDNVLISDAMDAGSLDPGPLHVTSAQNRTNTCATGAGQTPFTIDAVVISDYFGEDVSCNGAEDGQAFVNVSGGVGPFSFQWIGGGAPGFTQTYSNLGAGTYTVLVTDIGQGVICVDNVQVTEPALMSIFTFTYSPPSCAGLCNGVGTPIVIGGVPGYDFSWTTGETTQTATMLCEGSNTLTAIDMNGCQLDTTFQVVLVPLLANVEITDIICGGTNSGSALSTPTGGDGGPYSWLWSTGDIDNDIQNQPAGSYDLTVTDGGGCSLDTTFQILEEPPLVITLDDLQDESCGGSADGSIDITITGGAPVYQFDWTGPNGFTSSNEDLSGLSEGDYDLTLIDANLCEVMVSYTISAPPALALVLDATPISCFGADDGAIDLTISGGTPIYVVQWTGPNGFNSVSEDISGLAPGTYDVLVTDDNLCFEIASIDVTEPLPIDVATTITPPSCNGVSDAAIDIVISGGTPPYQTDWVGPAGFSSSNPNISGLATGDYDLTVTDANLCVIMITITIDDTPPIDVVFNVTDISCGGATDGAIDTEISGGTPPYSTNWTGPNGFASTNEDINGLEAGSYELTVTDFLGCFVINEVILNEPIPLSVVEVITDASCGGFFDGEIEISILGGTPLYIVSWTGPNGFVSSDEDISGLEAGDYDLNITDAAGCQMATSFTVDSPPILVVSLDVTPISCFGSNDGAIDLTISGGQPSYTVEWNGPAAFTSSSEDISNLVPGTYTLYVEDQNGCFAEEIVDLSEPTAMDVVVDSVDPTCFGLDDGSITLTISGGLEPYDIQWNTGDSGSPYNGLTADSYSVDITDDNGCLVTIDPIILSEPDELTLDLSSTDITCNGDNDGTITLTITGGTPAFVVDWIGPGAFSSSALTLTDLAPGTYDVTVMDDNGCIVMSSVDILEPEELLVDASVTDISCFGALGSIEIDISGGTGAYDILWIGPASFSSVDEDIYNLEEGTYTLEVSDDNGCFFTMDYDVASSDDIEVDAVVTNLDCSGLDNGAIDITITGGIPAYNILWVGPNGFNSSDEDLTGLAEGDYDLTVGDASGCTIDVTYTVSQPELLVVDATINPPLCAGQATGSIEIDVSGGVPGYDFLWTGPNGFSSVSEDIYNLNPGTYDLNIQDQGSCVLDVSYDVTDTPQITINASVTNVSCTGSGDGAIEIIVAGGTPGYSISWSGPSGYSSTDQNISNLQPGNYGLTITDANFCQQQLSVEVQDATPIDVVLDITNSTCGTATGGASVVITGGTDPVTISWQDDLLVEIGTGLSITDLAAGVYYLVVTDDNGCGSTTTVNISDSDVATLTAEITNVLCFGDFNGTINLTVTDGTAPFSYAWNGPSGFVSTDEDLTDLEAGDYIVAVQDSLGCISTEIFTVETPDVLNSTATPTDVSCNGEADGSIDLEIFGGTPVYLIGWTGPDGFLSVDEDLFDLAPGVYQVGIMDANGCLTSTEATVGESTELTIDYVATDFLCFGDASGEIDITLSGGDAPYSFLWVGPNSFSSINEDLVGIGPGDYTLSASDNQSCGLDTTITIFGNPEIEVDFDIVQPQCLQSDGSIEALVTGGTVAVDYSYFWYDLDNGNLLVGTDALLSGLPSGEYFLEVFDDNACTSAQSITLTDAGATIEGVIQDVLCFGGSNGTIDITVIGGNPDFTYEWNGPAGFSSNAEDVTDLVAGSYSVEATDVLGCLYGEVFEIAQPDTMQIGFTGSGVLCFGDINGAVISNVSGGTADYLYNWAGPNAFSSSSQNLSDLAPGCYDLQVTDANGCIATDQYCVTEPEEMAVVANITYIDCFGDYSGAIEIETSGGLPFYQFLWVGPNAFSITDEDIFDLEAGAYDLQVTDQNFCTYQTTFTVEQNDEILIDYSVTTPLCPGDGNGTISVTPSGGQPDYLFLWEGPDSFSSNAQNIADLIAGDYTINVSDELDCVVTQIITLSDPEPIDTAVVVSNISCFSEGDGSIEINILGGTGPFTTSWVGPNSFTSDDEDIFNLEAGTYELTITDFNFCSAVYQWDIIEPIPMDVTIESLQNTSCPASMDGSIAISVTGGEPDYTYDWMGPDGFMSVDEDIADIGIGSYDVTITDSNGCTLTVNSIPVIAGGDVTASAPDDLFDCYLSGPWVLTGSNEGGQSDLWIDENGANLGAGDSLWINPEPGTYMFIYQAIDNTCVDQDTVLVTIWDLPMADAGEDQFIFVEETVELGGDPTTELENTVIWSPGWWLSDSTSFNPATIDLNITTEFVVNITDLNGCLGSDTVLVNVIPEIGVPSGFTPNGDGQNDGWAISNIAFYENSTIEIYNRWGDLLFNSTGYGVPWDGTYDGTPLPIGTYYYVININEPEFPEPLSGPVTILR
jgi:large repetitive protein